MTREKALLVSDLIFKIERYEAFIEELRGLPGLEELYEVFGETALEDDLIAVVQTRLDILNKELEAL